jgi:tRNA threonylcarbamoyladenosine biosynthesis protein TsaB
VLAVDLLMLILATDTSGKYGSIALARCEGHGARVLDLVPLQGGTFSAQLVPQISQLLAKHNLSKSDIDAFAVVSGPGSFTGLRVGLAAIKALAEILREPIVAVSLLEVIAFGLCSQAGDLYESAPAALQSDLGRTGGEVLTALDAGRNEVYVGEYRLAGDRPVCLAESLFTLDQLAQRASELPVCTPDENVFARLPSEDNGSGRPRVFQVERPNASLVARLGYEKILAGQTIAPEALDATYIRRADAEIKTASPKPS